MRHLHAAAGAAHTPTAQVVLAVAAALIAAVLLAEAVAALLRSTGRRSPLASWLAHRTRNPVRLVLAVVGVQAGVRLVADPPLAFERWTAAALVAALTWLAAVVGLGLVAAAAGRLPVAAAAAAPTTRGSRALVTAGYGVVLAVVVLGGAAGVLAGFRSTLVVAVGVGAVAVVLLAAVVAAAHGWLRDVAAGLELASADALRVGDVVRIALPGGVAATGSAPGEGPDAGPGDDVPGTVWGRVEEITATTVVLQAWDDRRVVLPARRLAEQGFESWTRRTADLVGTVDVDLAPGVPVADVRAALLQAVERNDLWDRRVAVLQVVDATGGRVRVRATVSAADAPRLADLRCDVREALVEHLARMRPGRGDEGAPGPGAAGRSGDTTVTVDPRRDSRLFTGSVFAVERSQAFTGPGAAVLAERDAAVEG